ncbi:MAG: 1-acyl-sn-glycerol-3-phosphate acyltransferase [Thermomicrobiales bacterium]
MAARRQPVAGRIGRHLIGAFCAREVGRKVDLVVEGRDNVPTTGPVILAARHVHHLLDGCILTGIIDRPVHILVAVDWVPPGPARQLLDRATTLLQWPTVVRDESGHAENPDEVGRRLRSSTRSVIDLLKCGSVVLIFPEGYPNVDPHPNRKTSLADFLPFRPGFARLAALADRSVPGGVPIVPVGFWYQPLPGERWHVVVRIGMPQKGTAAERAMTVRQVEQTVRELSVAPGPTPR